MFKTILFLSVAVAITSCDTIIDLEEPLKGNITLATDWSKRTEGIPRPASYKVVINDQTLNFTEASDRLPELEAGTYPIHIYNTPEKISISGTTAIVATTSNIVDPLPGWLFTTESEAVYADFKKETITAIMQQQTRQLTIELTITEGNPERIASIAATLTGIANSLDFKSNTHSGTNLSVSPVFTRDGNKLTSIIRLLGTVTEEHTLILDITFTDGKTQHIASDVSNTLANFNTNKHIPLSISANLNTPVETGFAATITGWKVKESSNGIAW